MRKEQKRRQKNGSFTSYDTPCRKSAAYAKTRQPSIVRTAEMLTTNLPGFIVQVLPIAVIASKSTSTPLMVRRIHNPFVRVFSVGFLGRKKPHEMTAPIEGKKSASMLDQSRADRHYGCLEREEDVS